MAHVSETARFVYINQYSVDNLIHFMHFNKSNLLFVNIDVIHIGHVAQKSNAIYIHTNI